MPTALPPGACWPARLSVVLVLLALAGVGPGCYPQAALPPGTPTGLRYEIDEPSRTLTVRWEPAPRAVAWRAEVRLDPAGDWFPAQAMIDPSGPAARGPLPRGIWDPIPLQVRVTAVGRTGLSSEPSAPLDVLITANPLPPSTRFVVADPVGRLVADHATLVARGLDTFPDGLLAPLPTGTPGVYDFFASQGDGSDGMGGSLGTGFGRVRGTLEDPFAQVLGTRQPIQALQVPADYVGGGAVWRDPATGLVVMLYHREVYTREGGQPTGAFWSSIGAAFSWDGGSSFTDAGEVLTPAIPIDAPTRGPSGNGPGDLSTVARDGWLYAYYNDNLADGSMVLAVARTSTAGLLAAAGGGPAPVFWKLRDGAFAQPGLGGTPSAVSEGFNPSVAWSACREEFVMVTSGYTNATQSMLMVATSPDGLAWSAPEPLYATLAPYRIYNTLVGDTVDAEGNRVATGASLRVLAVDFPSSTDFWSAHAVRLVEVLDLEAAAGCTR